MVDRWPAPADLPVMLCPTEPCEAPERAEAAVCLGIMPELDPDKIYDVTVVGAGPAGLATAVYGGSEGLSVLVLTTRLRRTGRRLGADRKLFRFPDRPLRHDADRARLNQALEFGAESLSRSRWLSDCGGQPGTAVPIALDCRRRTRRAQVVIASGARYRRPEIANLADFEGPASHWASQIEAKLCEGEEVALVAAAIRRDRRWYFWRRR